VTNKEVLVKTIVVSNSKGGIGKTTISINLSAGLARKGYKVLLIDLDPQGQSTVSLQVKIGQKQTVSDLLCDKNCRAVDVIQDTSIEGLHIVPSDINIAVAEIELSSLPAKEFQLRSKIMDQVNYDFVIIDSSPTFGNLLANAFQLANYVIIPIHLRYLSLVGSNTFLDVIHHMNENVGSFIKHRTEILGVLYNFYKVHTNQSKRILEGANSIFCNLVFKTTISENIKLSEAQEAGQSIFDYAAGSSAAQAFEELTNEVLERLQCKVPMKL
jgi:chromosome partitioning protein